MADRPLRYFLELSGQRIPLRVVRGREAMSETFVFDVEAVVPPEVAVDPESDVKTEASLVLARDDDRRRIDGIVSEIYFERAAGGERWLYVRLEPRFSLSRLRTNHKAFLEKSVPDMVAEVLSELSVSHSFRLAGSYPPRPYTVQYGESDFHFVSRLLEEEGMHYFFAEGGEMVIGDGTAYDEAGSFPFFQPAGMDRHDESVWALGPRGEAGVSQVTLRDFNLETPSLDMDVAAAGPMPGGPELYDFPGEYAVPADGERIATRMAEASQCAASGVAGEASAATLGHGRVLSVTGAPADLDGGYVATVVEHDYEREREGFAVTFEGLDAGTAYRPPRIHEEPVIPNPLTGFVVGAPGEDIHTEELARVKVHFHWDRLNPYDDTCSPWIPVVQDNTGHSTAMPRIGWEVVVHFMEGDPDRPVVLGRVYNAGDPFPITLPDRKTRSALMSLSSPSRHGNNQIELEDLAGEERILVHAQRDQNIVVGHDRTERVLASEQDNVERDERLRVERDQEVRVGADAAPTVIGNQDTTVGGNARRSIGAGETVSVGGDHVLSIGSSHQRRIGGGDTTGATNLSESIGGVVMEASIGNNGTAANRVLTRTVGGAVLELAGKAKSETANKARVETIGGLVLSKADEEIKSNIAKKRITTVGALKRVKAEGQLSLVANEGWSAKLGSGLLEAEKEVTLEVGDSRVTLKEDGIQVLASDTVRFTIKGDAALGSEESKQN